MIFLKRTLAALTALVLIIPLFCILPNADSDVNFVFIDGQNVVRQPNSAVIYFGVKDITLNSRGHDIVFDADGIATEIYEGTVGSDRVIKIPENGCVVSSAGSATEWFKSNVKKGKQIRYDQYTQRLFLCDGLGNHDPYFSKTVAVSGEGAGYTVLNEGEAVSKYGFKVAVDANGVITARGGNITAPEGGFTVSAVTESDRKTLLTCAIVGGTCTVLDGIATFSYDSTMTFKTMELAVANAKATLESAKNAFADIDYAKAESLIQYADSALLNTQESDYYAATGFAISIENEILNICSEDNVCELRAAFHTPIETSIDDVRKTVTAAKNAGLNTIIIKTANSVGTIIPLPSSFPFEQDELFGGFDVLQAYVDVCKQENIALTLCVDVYYNKYAGIANKSWVAKNDDAASTVEGAPEYGTVFENKYFSPASEGFKEYFLSYIEYIVTHYQINSLMLDYLRYPKFSELTDLGYDDETMTLFSREVKQPISECFKIRHELFASPLWEDWVSFRTSLIDGMAKSVSETVRGVRSDVSLIAVAARESVNYYYMQNAVGWVENGIMDGLCLALYEGETEENDPIPPLGYHGNMVSEKGKIFSAYTANDAFLFMGLESEKSLSAQTISGAIGEARNIGADGFVFSTLNGYIAQGYYSYLNQGTLKGNAVSPFSDTAGAMKTILEYSKTKITDRILPNGGCDEAAKNSAIAQIDARIALLSDGALSYEQAVMLESDIAMIFASSPAKNEIMQELEALTKLALLAKDKQEEVVPPVSDPDASTPDESDQSTESTESNITNESHQSLPQAPEYISDSGENESGIGVGTVLIYVFVGIAAVAAVAGIITAARRKESKPVNRHMARDTDDEKSDGDK